MAKRAVTKAARRLSLRNGLVPLAISSDDALGESPRNTERRIDLSCIFKDKALTRFSVSEVSREIESYNPDLLVPVPSGVSQSLGELAARKINIEVAHVEFDDDLLLQPVSAESMKKIDSAESIIIFHDVRATGAKSHAVAASELVRPKLAGVVSLWSRLPSHQQIGVPYPVSTIIDYPVPLVDNPRAAHG